MKIFICYPSEHRSIAEEIAVRLRQKVVSGRPVRVFFDKTSLESGKGFDERIEREIKSSDLMIVLVAPETFDKGSYTINEIDLAKKKWENPSGRILPVEVSQKKIAKPDPYIGSIHWASTRGSIVPHAVSEAEKMIYSLASEKETEERKQAAEDGSIPQLKNSLKRFYLSAMGVVYNLKIAVKEKPLITAALVFLILFCYFVIPKHFIQYVARSLMNEEYYNNFQVSKNNKNQIVSKASLIIPFCDKPERWSWCNIIDPRQSNPIKFAIESNVSELEKQTDAKITNTKKELNNNISTHSKKLLESYKKLIKANKIQVDTIYSKQFHFSTPFQSGNVFEKPNFEVRFLAHHDQEIKIRAKVLLKLMVVSSNQDLSKCPDEQEKMIDNKLLCFGPSEIEVNHILGERINNVYIQNSSGKYQDLILDTDMSVSDLVKTENQYGAADILSVEGEAETDHDQLPLHTLAIKFRDRVWSHFTPGSEISIFVNVIVTKNIDNSIAAVLEPLE